MSKAWKALFFGDLVIKKPPRKLIADDLQKLIAEHELCSCNFEAPVESTGKPINKAGVYLSQHQFAPQLICDAGFNVISLANNHIYDYGQEGLERTIAEFKSATIVGAGVDFKEVYALKVIKIKGIKIGLLSYCESEFGALTSERLTRGGYAWINHPMVSDFIQQAKKIVEVLIVQIHAGAEEVDLPLPGWRERYKEIVRLGADVIVGGHPHVPQGWEMYQGKPIFYSLGNFYFDMDSNHPYWNKGICVSLSFDGSKMVDYEVIGIEKTSQGVNISADPTMTTHLEKLCVQLKEPDYYYLTDKQALWLWEDRYRDYYEGAMNGVTSATDFKRIVKLGVNWLFRKDKIRPNLLLLLHNIRNETHRWAVERALSLLVEVEKE